MLSLLFLINLNVYMRSELIRVTIQISYRMDLKHRISHLMTGSVQNQLDVLSLLLKEVYQPLEGRNAETRKNLEKFISHISHTSVQVSGTVSIQLPIVAIGDDI
jgi:hypothetical protein